MIDRKPSYEELEKRIEELERTASAARITVTVRALPLTVERLEKMARAEGISKQEMFDQAIEREFAVFEKRKESRDHF